VVTTTTCATANTAAVFDGGRRFVSTGDVKSQDCVYFQFTSREKSRIIARRSAY